MLCQTVYLVDNHLGVDGRMSQTKFNRFLNPFGRMLSQQLQDADIVSGGGERSQATFKRLPKCSKTSRKLPVTVRLR